MTQEKEIELIIGNSGRNFSGGTSITIQLLQYQNNLMKLAILGSSYMPKNYKTLTKFESEGFLKYIKIKNKDYLLKKYTNLFKIISFFYPKYQIRYKAYAKLKI